MTKINVLFDTTPLQTGHSIRGIGSYTRQLLAALEQDPGLILQRSTTKDDSFIPDIIHFPFFDLFHPSLPLLKKTPLVATIHDVIPLLFPEFYPVGIKGKLALRKQRLALRRAASIITDSESSKKDIEQYLKIAKDKIVVIPLAAHQDLGPSSLAVQKKIKEMYHLPDTFMLYVGDINYNKNIPQLIKSLKFLPEEMKLVLVGKNFTSQDIPEWQWIETQIALSNVAERVQFVTDLTSDAITELSAFYSLATVYVQPSLYEGFGLPPLEAMQCKTPVVCTNLSSLPEVVGTHAVMTGPTAEELAEGVKTVLSWSKVKRAEVLSAAWEWSKNFTWKRTAQLTKKVNSEIVDNKP